MEPPRLQQGGVDQPAPRLLLAQGGIHRLLGEKATRDQQLGESGRHGSRGILRPRPQGTMMLWGRWGSAVDQLG